MCVVVLVGRFYKAYKTEILGNVPENEKKEENTYLYGLQ